MKHIRRFLVVDDQPDITLIVSKILAPLGDCLIANSPEQGIRVFQEYMQADQPFDAVLMDIMMPGMDGHEVARRLRTIENDHKVTPGENFKLIMISALSDTKNVCKSFFQGGLADSYLCKPLTREVVLAEMRNMGLTS